MPSISSVGVGSNLPLNELLENLRKSESVALVRIGDQKKLAEARVSAYGVLKGALEKLNDTARALGKADTLAATRASVSGDAFTAVSQSGAIAGRYDVQVTQLATSQTLVAAIGQASRSARIGGTDAAGVISFQVNGETKTLDLAGRGTSLDDIVKAINASDLGVDATLINDGSDTPYRLMLTTHETGAQSQITEISVAGNDALQAVLGYPGSTDSGMQQNVAAVDAALTVNGIAITSSSNTIEDVIEGVSLTLTKTTSQPQSLTISADLEASKSAIQQFVDAYNALQNHIANLTRYDQNAKQHSVLTGDSAARTIQTRVRGIIDVSMADNAYANLAQLGISTDPNDGGKLRIDDKALTRALQTDSAAVARLLGGEMDGKQGVAARTDAIVKPMLAGEHGLLVASEGGARKMVASLAREFEHTEERIDATLARYRSQFVALDGMVAQMNGISNYLTQQLGMLAIKK